MAVWYFSGKICFPPSSYPANVLKRKKKSCSRIGRWWLIKNNKFLNSKISDTLKKFSVTQHLQIEIIQNLLFLCVEIRALNKKLFFSTKLYLQTW